MKDFSKYSAIIIGAGDATGSALCKKFADNGYKVCAVRRPGNLDKFKKLKTDVEQSGGWLRVFGVDARDGIVATEGWAKSTNISATELAKSFEDAGVCSIIYTDINRDGAMQGPNVQATAELANEVSIPIIASGGVSKMDDIIALKSCGAELNGVISGRALYDGAIDLKKALEIL